jgi:hypothetical protein
MDLGPRPSDDEMDDIVAQLREAGLPTIATDAKGRETWTLTDLGARLAQQMAFSGEQDALELMGALLDVVEGGTPTR